MAEAEGKNGNFVDVAKISEIMEQSSTEEKTQDIGKQSSSTMTSSWSGWFQRVNDVVLGIPPSESKDSEENVESVSGSKNDEKGTTWSAWGNSLLQQAKEKTLTTFELVKKDLTEFSDVVQNETASIVSATASTIRERAPQLVDNLVESVNTLLVEDTTRGEKDLEVPITADTVAIANRSQARLYAIQSDPGTYCNEPDGAPELFDDWLDNMFKLEDKKDEISHLLVTNPTVRNLFAQLVPLQVSNTTFWQRYFYKLHQFELDEARRRALLQREEAAAGRRGSSDNVKLSWGDESESDEQHDQPSSNADMEASYDLVTAEAASLSSRGSQDSSNQSPLCGREPPEGVSAIPKSWMGDKRDSFNVELKASESQEDPKLIVQLPDTDFSSISSMEMPSKNDAESSSPTDKKSDGWVEWEGNES